ncbi:MAG: TetR/AcrR family transcriptional regulator [Pseudomonadota bacterium]
MTTRQRIGLRKPPVKMRAPGRKRRQALIDAAYALLCERDVDDVSFRDVATQAGVPEGSAYHFFANRFDLFSAVADSLSDKFIEAHRAPIPAAKRASWTDLANHLVEVGADVYAANPPARQLLIGGKTPPEVKQADRRNDRAVAAAMHASFSRYFDLPDSDQMRDAFYYFIEITDLIFTLSIIEHGKITAPMLAEAKRAGVAYLNTFRSQ